MGIWVAREVLSLPVVAFMVKRATGIGYAAQFGGAKLALAASGCMAIAVQLARHLLPLPGGPAGRLAILATVGAVAYLGAALLFNRRAVLAVGDFVLSARQRRADQPAET
jgi:hypothetical protein